ncbi:hypothetical protein Pfo_015704 [Paulownia fortunei]|nr:hypothetical protein Pfo_015704 [Paulownia fortunei]
MYWTFPCRIQKNNLGTLINKLTTVPGMASPDFRNTKEVALYLGHQLEIQRKIHNQLEVQRKLQMQIEEQGRHLKMLYDKKMNKERQMVKASTSDSHSNGFQAIRSKI